MNSPLPPLTHTPNATTRLNQGWDNVYADRQGPVWQEAPIPILKDSIELLQAAGARTVLDVGCGDGRNLCELVSAGFLCAGMDVSLNALAHASANVRKANGSAILLPGDCHALPTAPGTLDAITAFDVFGQLLQPELFIESSHRCLRPGGILIANAFTIDDGTYGEGEPAGQNRFMYRDTLFRYFESIELEQLFRGGWRLAKLDRVTWDDPPHPGFRDYAHRHVNFFVVALREP